MATAMLNDLLNNALDSGYRARSAAPKRRHWWDGPAVWVACVAAGLLLVTAYQQTHRSAPARETARQDLEGRIHNVQAQASTMDAEAKRLAAEVAKLRDQQLSPSDGSSLRNLEIASGSVAVTGPGVSIEVGEPADPQSSASSGRTGTGSQPQNSVLRDRDLREIVNQLWISGAEAIAINGIRLTATSAIRFAGESILVDFQTLSSPYTVAAVGDRDKMLLAFADSAVARKFKTEQGVYGIAFAFSGKSKLSLPSVTVVQQSDASLGPAPSSSAPPSASVKPTPTETSR
jgi:uncharacterized protein YlxW (UPF0749 family)